MTTVEYAAWAGYADRNIGDIRAHQVLALIGTNIYNYMKKKDTPACTPNKLTPWIDWGESSEQADPLCYDRLGE